MKIEHVTKLSDELNRFGDQIQTGKAVLAYSGGKDSLACLFLLRAFLKDLYVIFVDAGKAYPESRALAEWAQRQCPKFIWLRTDREAQWKEHGLPSDLVPIDWTTQGQQLMGEKPVRIQSYLQCCWENISLPMLEEAKALGATLMIRGQRNDETRKALSRTGSVVEGMTFWHPLENWTREEVLEYVNEELGGLPPHFALEHTSMDCYDCTGFTRNAHDRGAYTKEHHPKLYEEYRAKMKLVGAAIEEQVEHYRRICGGDHVGQA